MLSSSPVDGPITKWCPERIPLSNTLVSSLCYPHGYCGNVIMELEKIGIEYLCFANRYAGNPILIGKGHSSVVALALLDSRPVAIKIRRIDSKRRSLWNEGIILERAYRAGAAPKPYYYSDNIIIMDYVPGPHFEELMNTEYATRAVLEAILAARALDSMNILHYELRRPWRHIRFTESLRAVILDYESAGLGCGSLTKLIGGIYYFIGGKRVLDRIKSLLREYNRNCSRDIFERIIEVILWKKGVIL